MISGSARLAASGDRLMLPNSKPCFFVLGREGNVYLGHYKSETSGSCQNQFKPSGQCSVGHHTLLGPAYEQQHKSLTLNRHISTATFMQLKTLANLRGYRDSLRPGTDIVGGTDRFPAPPRPRF